MQITRQADYAVRAVSFLARLSPGERVPTSLIAERQRIPQTFLAKIIFQLSAAGIIRAAGRTPGRCRPGASCRARQPARGHRGHRRPGPPERVRHQADVCSMSDVCPVRSVWCKAQAELVERLQGTAFSQLTAPNMALAQIAA